ncbi:MFS transporter [Quadrisphaera sp. INWT6]|uniref:MFS transporter n=1 Tax=Quadrisphaera sp. INWT6 TaxID=2596917 RepID=UPI0018921CA8|nr:MFS transporter [Quadrisphaera sp. INWT6]MBF5082865.1 MFS transporter [Quadrisphaera sp. INWT6]
MGLLTPYRGALATPGAPAFAAAGLLARLPLSMNGLALVLLAQGLTRDWAAAGAVAATYALAQALVSPLLSRLVDRHGQARVALPALAVHAAALLAVLLIAATGAHLLLLGLAAALAGAAFVSWGSLVRARWAHALRGPDGARHLHPAFSLESVLDEVVFTVGPPVATLLAVAVSPSVALGAALASTVAGGVALLAQRRTEPPPHRADPAAEAAEGAEVSGGGAPAGLRARVGRAVGALRVPGLRALALTFVATGAVFGSVEVIAVAFTAERGVPGAAGVVLALYSVGSLVAGVAFGAVTWRGSLPRRFRLGAVGMAVLIAPVALAGKRAGAGGDAVPVGPGDLPDADLRQTPWSPSSSPRDS